LAHIGDWFELWQHAQKERTTVAKQLRDTTKWMTADASK
jgi:hypothetical protein